MMIGRYTQAIELLNRRIDRNPTDAEAHFQLGICYISTGNYPEADERFESAGRLKPDYRHMIGREYREVGSECLGRGDIGSVIAMFAKAVNYQPTLRKGITRECFDAGRLYLSFKRRGTADVLLSLSKSYDRELVDEIRNLEADYRKEFLERALH
jgi:tetratricopeptide (TPR) repeat protein